MLKKGTGEWLIPEPLRSEGSAIEICAHVEWDHARHAALGGTCDPRNLTPRTKEDHAEKTNKIDKPAIAKCKRIEQKEREFRDRILAKEEGEAKELIFKLRNSRGWSKRKIPSRPFPKRINNAD
jgi:hypothetical protein